MTLLHRNPSQHLATVNSNLGPRRLRCLATSLARSPKELNTWVWPNSLNPWDQTSIDIRWKSEMLWSLSSLHGRQPRQLQFRLLAWNGCFSEWFTSHWQKHISGQKGHQWLSKIMLCVYIHIIYIYIYVCVWYVFRKKNVQGCLCPWLLTNKHNRSQPAKLNLRLRNRAGCHQRGSSQPSQFHAQ